MKSNNNVVKSLTVKSNVKAGINLHMQERRPHALIMPVTGLHNHVLRNTTGA
jgi:hypothetical protein